jgi:hypothetical protein
MDPLYGLVNIISQCFCVKLQFVHSTFYISSVKYPQPKLLALLAKESHTILGICILY